MKVRYKADRSIVGWVINVTGENARVFIEGSDKLVPLSELEPPHLQLKCRWISSKLP